WTQQTKLTGGNEIGAGSFGVTVALSADANTALVGGPFDNNDVGAAWVFTRSGGIWGQQAKLTPGGASGAAPWFGFNLALSTDGGTALIGGPGDTSGRGAAWVFVRSGANW